MEELKRTHEVAEITDEYIIVRTIIDEKFTLQEATQETAKHEANIPKITKNIESLHKFVDEKGWEPELENLEKGKEREELLIKLFADSLEPYYAKLREKGEKAIKKFKVKEHYKRLSGDRKTVKRVEILNQVREEMGLDDIAHPVVQELRADFDKL